ncbi:MAG: UMP kinase, partial [Victivallales bacterium]|nr:UMP kinase [Victivallales bacterium]
MGGPNGGIAPAAVADASQIIREATSAGAQIAVIIGAGNLFRGLAGSRKGMDRCGADYIGMLGTCMNALAMRDTLEASGIPAVIQSALPITGVLEPFDYRLANEALNHGKVLLFAAGTG